MQEGNAMKFKDKDGNVFEDIEAVHNKHCGESDCHTCKLEAISKAVNEILHCTDWVNAYPAEAARLMGYEVVEESSLSANKATRSEEKTQEIKIEVKKEANMDKQKPLKAWTLGEVQKYCESLGEECVGCPFFVEPNSCCFERKEFEPFNPESWDEFLYDKPRFTEQEVEAAKAIVTLFSGVWTGKEISRCHDGTLLVLSRAGGETVINKDLFPSIQAMQTVKLSDIIGGEDL